MKYILILSTILLSGCSTMKSVNSALEKAAKVAVGPCGQRVSEAIAVCNATKNQLGPTATTGIQ